MSIIEDIMRQSPSLRAFALQKMRDRRRGGQVLEERVLLFPGYIFFSVNGEEMEKRLRSNRFVYRLLCDSQGDWRLKGSDKKLVEQMQAENGIIGISKAYYEGDRICVLEGFLKGREAQIMRINRRARTAQVRIGFMDKEVTPWLGYELMPKEHVSQA